MNSKTKNRLKLIFIIILFSIPVMTAWLVFKNPQWLEDGKTKNYGELITPAVPSELSDFVINTTDSKTDHLKGRWVLLHLDFDAACKVGCEKSIYTVRQLHTLLNKDASRLVRVYFDGSNGAYDEFLSVDKKLSVYRWGNKNMEKIRSLVAELSDGDMLLLDPLGNIMMRYRQDADPYGIQRDLKLLFKASQIG